MPGVQPRDRGNRVAGIHGVGSTAAMQVQVNEAGQHQRPHGIGARLGFADGLAIHGHDAAVVGTQVPLHEPSGVSRLPSIVSLACMPDASLLGRSLAEVACCVTAVRVRHAHGSTKRLRTALAARR